MPPARDGAVGTGLDDRVDEPQQFGRRRRAVGVHERDQWSVDPAERLHDHATLAELGVAAQPDTWVLGGVLADDTLGAVGARVERDQQLGVRVGAYLAVRLQSWSDPALFVVGREHDSEEGQRSLRLVTRVLSVRRERALGAGDAAYPIGHPQGGHRRLSLSSGSYP